MKKFFTLCAAVAMMAIAANAGELTVADGTVTNAHYPMYGLYYDTPNTRSQVIYPEFMLNDLVGKQITSLKFYSRDNQYMTGGNLQYSLKVVEQSEFATATPVELGEEDIYGNFNQFGGYELVLTLDKPFQYNGGNLLLETLVTQGGDYSSCYFYGIETGLVGAMYQYQGWYSMNAYSEAFLPKVTFTFEEGTTPVDPTEKTDAPSSQKVNYVYNDGNMYYNAYTVTLIPAETEPNCDIYYRVGVMVDGEYVYGDWMLYTGELNFDDEGSYMVEAYAIAADKTESDHIWDGFTVSKLVDVEEIMAGKTVAGVRYFNMAGQEMAQPAGLTIQVTTYTDGTTSAVKVMK